MDSASRDKIISSHRHLISSSMSTVSTQPKGNFSVDDSGPPSPTTGPVVNFAEVAPGIYRSSFPTMGNFEHLKSVGLKTILTLVTEPYPSHNVQFMKENGIQHFTVPIPAHKNDSVTIPLQNIASALEILMNPEMHPVLVHCNKGKHRTGCIVACYRRIHYWNTDAVITEYRKYAGAKARPLDEQFIQGFDVPSMLVILKNSRSSFSPRQAMLPTPPASDLDYDNVEDDSWTLHCGI